MFTFNDEEVLLDLLQLVAGHFGSGDNVVYLLNGKAYLVERHLAVIRGDRRIRWRHGGDSRMRLKRGIRDSVTRICRRIRDTCVRSGGYFDYERF